MSLLQLFSSPALDRFTVGVSVSRTCNDSYKFQSFASNVAHQLISSLSQDLHGRNLRVSAATERTAGFRNGAGYGGGGGGFGGGGYGGGGYGGGGYGGNSGGGGGFAPAGGDNFAAGNFGGASGFGGNPAGNHGAPAGSTGGDEFSLGTPGSTFESTKNDDVMDDLFKDDEPDKYASKNV